MLVLLTLAIIEWEENDTDSHQLLGDLENSVQQLKIEDMPCSAANLRWDLNISTYIMTDLRSWKGIADSKMPLSSAYGIVGVHLKADVAFLQFGWG